jgi:hypothetical protein
LTFKISNLVKLISIYRKIYINKTIKKRMWIIGQKKVANYRPVYVNTVPHRRLVIVIVIVIRVTLRHESNVELERIYNSRLYRSGRGPLGV